MENANSSVKDSSCVEWAGSSNLCSLTAHYSLAGGIIVNWSSKKQTAVAKLTTKTEYRSMPHVACEVIWLLSL